MQPVRPAAESVIWVRRALGIRDPGVWHSAYGMRHPACGIRHAASSIPHSACRML
ncbi:hypothetical protein [Paenibacillus lignilyticus]|uniref:Uncharacterized protein n=1 Tax=Paenibacillus lignilyticus TaxID=1172615 RepID=A0ABS5CJT0_9BACL|nr:hypothetical protein [Paenibacillus lignilyticus]MBP3966118.1 hypothetical protein [Paenibacillus lignilyticus]